MLLREVTAQATLELTKLKANVDEDILEQMLEDHKLTLTYKDKPFTDVIRKLYGFAWDKTVKAANAAFNVRSLTDKHRVFYAPRERAIYVRFVFERADTRTSNLIPVWHELKLPMTLKAKELSLGTVTQVMKDSDTLELTRFVYPKPKKQP